MFLCTIYEKKDEIIMRRVVITESQYAAYCRLSEADGKLKIDVDKAVKDIPNSGTMNASQKLNTVASKLGNPSGVDYVTGSETGTQDSSSGTVNDSVIRKSDIDKAMREALKRNSKLYTVKDFLAI